MARHHVPTARFLVAETAEVAFEALRSERLGWPLVIKADGLAAGKGVVLVNTTGEAMAIIDEMLTGTRFGEAGRRIVLEECLVGPEVSFFVLSDGRQAMPIGSAQDHKRALDGDRGPNTGGMGAFAPSPLMTPELEAQVLQEVVHPVLAGMREEGHPYRGFLYCGLMLTAKGPMVIEFNARLGDPEAQVILPLIDEPLLPLLDAAAAGALARSTGAPEPPTARRRRRGFRRVSGSLRHWQAHHRSCRGRRARRGRGLPRRHHARDDGRVVTSGGRVLTVVGRGADYKAAIARAYAGVERIKFDGAYCRKDIGKKALRLARSASPRARREPPAERVSARRPP